MKKIKSKTFINFGVNQNKKNQNLNHLKTMKNTKRTQVLVVGVSLKFNKFLVQIFRFRKKEHLRRAQEIELLQ